MDNDYLFQAVGLPLTQCLAEVAEKVPLDPIEWIAHWLYRYVDRELYFLEKTEFLNAVKNEHHHMRREQIQKQKDRALLRQKILEDREKEWIHEQLQWLQEQRFTDEEKEIFQRTILKDMQKEWKEEQLQWVEELPVSAIERETLRLSVVKDKDLTEMELNWLDEQGIPPEEKDMLRNSVLRQMESRSEDMQSLEKRHSSSIRQSLISQEIANILREQELKGGRRGSSRRTSEEKRELFKRSVLRDNPPQDLKDQQLDELDNSPLSTDARSRLSKSVLKDTAQDWREDQFQKIAQQGGFDQQMLGGRKKDDDSGKMGFAPQDMERRRQSVSKEKRQRDISDERHQQRKRRSLKDLGLSAKDDRARMVPLERKESPAKLAKDVAPSIQDYFPRIEKQQRQQEQRLSAEKEKTAADLNEVSPRQQTQVPAPAPARSQAPRKPVHDTDSDDLLYMPRRERPPESLRAQEAAIKHVKDLTEKEKEKVRLRTENNEEHRWQDLARAVATHPIEHFQRDDTSSEPVSRQEAPPVKFAEVMDDDYYDEDMFMVTDLESEPTAKSNFEWNNMSKIVKSRLSQEIRKSSIMKPPDKTMIPIPEEKTGYQRAARRSVVLPEEQDPKNKEIRPPVFEDSEQSRAPNYREILAAGKGTEEPSSVEKKPQDEVASREEDKTMPKPATSYKKKPMKKAEFDDSDPERLADANYLKANPALLAALGIKKNSLELMDQEKLEDRMRVVAMEAPEKIPQKHKQTFLDDNYIQSHPSVSQFLTSGMVNASPSKVRLAIDSVKVVSAIESMKPDDLADIEFLRQHPGFLEKLGLSLKNLENLSSEELKSTMNAIHLKNKLNSVDPTRLTEKAYLHEHKSLLNLLNLSPEDIDGMTEEDIADFMKLKIAKNKLVDLDISKIGNKRYMTRHSDALGLEAQEAEKMKAEELERLANAKILKNKIDNLNLSLVGDMNYLRKNVSVINAIGLSIEGLESLPSEQRGKVMKSKILTHKLESLDASKLTDIKYLRLHPSFVNALGWKMEQLEKMSPIELTNTMRNVKLDYTDRSKLMDKDYLRQHPSMLDVLAIHAKDLEDMDQSELRAYVELKMNERRSMFRDWNANTTSRAKWSLDCNLGLVCEHAVLGLLTGRPPCMAPETPDTWETMGHLNESLYDPEIYSCDNTDQLSERASVVSAMTFREFTRRVTFTQDYEYETTEDHYGTRLLKD